MPAVSEFTKAKILVVTLHQRGMSYGQISTNLGLSKGTIHPIMRNWEHTGTVVRRPGSGRRRVSSVEQNEAPPNYHRNLCLSMRNRLLLVVQQNRAMIKYRLLQF
jgi:predicted ArsR family transcriptional regulator